MIKERFIEIIRYNWSYIALVIMTIFLFRCCSQDIKLIPETPSSKEYVNLLLDSISKTKLQVQIINRKLSKLDSIHTSDSIQHINDVSAYKKLSRKEKVRVIERNIGPVIDTIGLICLDSAQMDSVNIAFKEVNNYEGVVSSLNESLHLKSKKINLMNGQLEDYSNIADKLINEVELVRGENGKLRRKLNRSVNNNKRNRTIAVISSVIAVVEGTFIYLSAKL